MANFRRSHCRRKVKCSICTRSRWLGNHKGRFKDREEITSRELRRGQVES